MMKILLLNPSIDAGHKTGVALQKKKVALLSTDDAEEAFQMLHLHGKSVDLAVIHREGPEGNLDAGIKLVARLKKDPMQSDLPIILTTDKWTDGECAKHQQGATGVNAYLRTPYGDEKLFGLIEQVLGQPLGGSGFKKKGTSTITEPKGPLILEEAASVFSHAHANGERSDTSIRLEAPDMDKSESEQIEPPAVVDVPPPSVEAPAAVAAPDLPLSIELPGMDLAPPNPTSAPPVPPTDSISVAPGAPELPQAGEVSSLIIAGDPEPEAQPVVSAPIPPPISAKLPEPEADIQQIPDATDEDPIASLPPADFSELEAEENAAVEPPVAESTVVEDAEADSQVVAEMPYLFGGSLKKEAKPTGQRFSVAEFMRPMGDAVVPGGAAHSPDTETLKKYLLLREQDVSALSAQLKSAREQLQALEETLRQERGNNVELNHKVEEQQRKIDGFEREKEAAVQSLQGEINELKFQIKAKTDKTRLLEMKVREAMEETERLKDRVRGDIRKIRVHEKELENRLEIMKKDSEALIGARENKIVELKRKLDLLEFNMDLLQDQYTREKENAAQLRERLMRAAKAVRLAGGVLDPSDDPAANAGEKQDKNSDEKAAS
jgi:hypothetical protein